MIPTAILIMGVSAAGKTTLGTALAEMLNVPFVEGDTFHSAANIEKMRSGHPLTDRDREPWLDAIGLKIRSSLRTNPIVVCACSALKRSYRDRLRRLVQSPLALVLLVASRETLVRRLAIRQGHFMPASLLDDQMQMLEPPETDEMAVTLSSEREPGQLVQEALALLRRQGMLSNPV